MAPCHCVHEIAESEKLLKKQSHKEGLCRTTDVFTTINSKQLSAQHRFWDYAC